jgi:hypothetical protein
MKPATLQRHRQNQARCDFVNAFIDFKEARGAGKAGTLSVAECLHASADAAERVLHAAAQSVERGRPDPAAAALVREYLAMVRMPLADVPFAFSVDTGLEHAG